MLPRYQAGCLKALSVLALLGFLIPVSPGLAVTGEMFEPPLGYAFPLEEKDGQVVLSSTVMLNQLLILPAGTVLRTIFLPAQAADADTKEERQKLNKDNAYSRPPQRLNYKDKDNLSPEQRATLERAIKNMWTKTPYFRGALQQFPLDTCRLVYVDGPSNEMKADRFDFPEGLLLTEDQGQIHVLTIEPETALSNRGIKPGSLLLKINDVDLAGSLATFQKNYIIEKKKSAEAGSTFTFTFLVKGESEPRTIQVGRGVSMGDTGFFAGSDLTNPKDEKPASPKPKNEPATSDDGILLEEGPAIPPSTH